MPSDDVFPHNQLQRLKDGYLYETIEVIRVVEGEEQEEGKTEETDEHNAERIPLRGRVNLKIRDCFDTELGPLRSDSPSPKNTPTPDQMLDRYYNNFLIHLISILFPKII